MTDRREAISEHLVALLQDEGAIDPGELVTDWVLLAATTEFDDDGQHSYVHSTYRRHDQPMHVEFGLIHERLLDLTSIKAAMRTRSVLQDNDDD